MRSSTLSTIDSEGPRQIVLGPLLGSGGSGDVYRAHRRSGGLETVVAVKVLHGTTPIDAGAVARLRSEGLLLRCIQHPGVVKALDFVVVEGRLALVTEYVPGADLWHHIHGPTPLPPRILLEVIGQVATTLSAAWTAVGPDGTALRIVHRDVKPSNIRLGAHGQVRLLDFGVARFQHLVRPETASNVVLGSMPYMAPERFAHRDSGPEVDVFGLGCCLFEGFAQERFHPAGTLRELSSLAVDADRFEVHRAARMARLPPLEDRVKALIVACLQFEPAARPSVGHLIAEIEAARAQTPGPTLRGWCDAASWPAASRIDGALSGWVVPPAPEGERATAVRPDRDGHGPQLVKEAPGTLDTGKVPGGGALSKKRPPDMPQAPLAFPSIPLGMAIEQLQISEEEVEAVLRDDSPEPPQAPPPAHLVARPEPPAIEDEPGGLRYALIGAGCTLAVILAGGAAAILTGAAAWFLL